MRRHAKILLRLIGCGTALAVFGQSPSVPTVVEIADLRAGSVRAPDVRTWLEYDVTVQVNAPGSGRERYVDRVQVVFNLALEVPGDPDGFEFYRAAATAVALEAGRSSFRFYLPPEIVRRDRVRGMPRFYLIDVTVAGEPQRRVRNRVGPGFSSPEAMENFRRQLSQRAPSNDCVLVPHHLSPFAANGPEHAYPTMVRSSAFTP